MAIRVLNLEPVTEKPVPAKGKLSIRQNAWGNWWAYVGTRRFKEIGASAFDAEHWLKTAQESRG